MDTTLILIFCGKFTSFCEKYIKYIYFYQKTFLIKNWKKSLNFPTIWKGAYDFLLSYFEYCQIW